MPQVIVIRLRSHSHEIIPLLRPQARVPRECVQSCLREQCYPERAYNFRALRRLTISSLRSRENLGFTKAGLISNAGRLEKEGGEECVTAIVLGREKSNHRLYRWPASRVLLPTVDRHIPYWVPRGRKAVNSVQSHLRLNIGLHTSASDLGRHRSRQTRSRPNENSVHNVQISS